MKTKTARRYPLTSVRMAIIRKSIYNKQGESVEKREPSSSVGGNVNWYILYGEQY